MSTCTFGYRKCFHVPAPQIIFMPHENVMLDILKKLQTCVTLRLNQFSSIGFISVSVQRPPTHRRFAACPALLALLLLF